MTVMNTRKKKTMARVRPEAATVILLGVSLASLFFLMRAPSVTVARMSDALSLCASTVIPSLFPFMVVSELLLSGDSASLLAPILHRPARRIFGVCGESAVAIILGLLCGFPIGAKGGAALYKSGRIDGRELERILTLSCIPSAPFLISTVGVSTFGSVGVGIRLLAACLISSLTVGMIIRRVKFKAPKKALLTPRVREPETNIAKLFTSAVSSSALSMLYICAFLTFFSTLVGVTESALESLAPSGMVSAVILGFFELTGGICGASELPDAGQYLAAAIAGWSGLSVHFQIMSVCQGCNISFKPYFLSKALSTLLCPLLMLLFDLIL